MSGTQRQLTAIVIAETFNNEFEPLTSAIPFALLPICNTPIIDFVLESLVQNGVNEVTVIAFAHFHDIDSHLATHRIATGRSWKDSHDVKVSTIEGGATVKTMFDAMQQVRHHNIIKEQFVLVPIDAVISTTGLRHLFDRHLKRCAEYGPSLVMTMVGVSEARSLHDLHDEVASRHVFAEPLMLASMVADTPGTIGSISFPDTTPEEEEATFSETPAAPRMCVSFETSTHVVRQLQLWEKKIAEEECVGAITLQPNAKRPVTLRSDLICTGIYFCTGEALTLFDFFMTSMTDLLKHIIASEEVQNHRFAIDILPKKSVVRFVTSVQAYLETNRSTTARWLFPMTRESNFADKNCLYFVERSDPTLYRHVKESRVGPNTGPNVVAGEYTTIPASAIVKNSVLRCGVTIGEGAVVVNSVLFDDVVVKDGAKVEHSIVGPRCKIGPKAHVKPRCVLGDGVRIGMGVHIPKGMRLAAPAEKQRSDTTIVGKEGYGVVYEYECKRFPLPMQHWFDRDQVGDEENDEDDEDDGSDLFLAAVHDEVAELLHTPATSIHALEFSLRQSRLSFQRTNGDVLRAVLQSLLTILGNKPPDEALEAFKAVVTQWLRPVLLPFLRNEEEMRCGLEGLCLGIAPTENSLRERAEDLLEFLHCGVDTELLKEKGHCLFSLPSMVEFGNYVESLQEEEEEELNDDDFALLNSWGLLHNYVELKQMEEQAIGSSIENEDESEGKDTSDEDGSHSSDESSGQDSENEVESEKPKEDQFGGGAATDDPFVW